MVALIREPPRDEGPARRVSLRSSHDEVDVSAIARRRAAAATARLPASRPRRRSTRSSSSCAASSCTATRCRLGRLDRSGSRWSTSRPGRRRSRSSRRCAGGRARAPATPARSTRSRPGCSSCSPGAATRLAPCFVGLDKRYVTDVALTSHDVDRRPRRRGRRASTPRRGRVTLDEALRGCAARSSCRSPLPPRSRSTANAPTGSPGKASPSRCRCGVRRSRAGARHTAQTTVTTRPARAARRLGHVRPRDRPGARRPLHDAAANRGRPVRVDEAAPVERSSSCRRRTRSSGSPDERSSACRRRPRRRARARAPQTEARVTSPERPASSAAARGRDRHVRRRPPGPPGGDPGRSRRRLRPTVVTFDPHPRTVLGNRVELLATLERRLELLAAAAPRTCSSSSSRPRSRRSTPEEFAQVPARDRRRGRGRRDGVPLRPGAQGDLELLRSLGLDAREVPLVEGVSSTADPAARAAATSRRPQLLGRPLELDGMVVSGDQRGGTLGFPTANLRVDADLLVPGVRDLCGRRRRPAGGGLDRRQPALRRHRAPHRGVPARLGGRPLRRPARASSSGGGCATSAPSRAKPTSSPRSPGTSRRPAAATRPG